MADSLTPGDATDPKEAHDAVTGSDPKPVATAQPLSDREKLLHLNTILGSIDDEIWFTDTAGQFRLVNAVGAQTFSLTAAAPLYVDQLARSVEVLRPDGTPRPLEEAPPLRALRGETVRRQEEIVRTPSTEELRFREVNATPVRDANGKIVGSVSVVRDVTEERSAKARLQSSSQFLELATEGAQIGLWHWAMPGDKLEWSDRCKALFELPPDTQPTFDYFYSVLHPDDRERVRQLLAEAVERRTDYAAEYRVMGRDGAIRWLSAPGRVFVGPDGELAGMSGIVIDISKRKLNEEALARTRDLLAESQKIAHLGSFEYLPASQTTTWSDEQYRIHGLDPTGPSPNFADIVANLVHPADAETAAQAFLQAVRTHGSVDLEHRIMRPDGTERWIHTIARPDFDENGTLIRYVGTTLDITDRKATEARLEQAKIAAEAANKAKTEFLANMSHEIRTPLNGIMGLAAIIRNQGLNPRQTELMNKLEVASRHLLEILSDILDMTRIEAGKLPFVAQAFDADALLKGMRSLLQEEIERKGLRLLVDAPMLPTRLLGDPVRIRQAYLNLLGNAIKFTDQGQITLRVTKAEEDAASVLLRFEVEDTGIGVAADVLPRLFTNFEQADNSMTRKYGGTGLGLALVRRLAGLMGGDAGATSQPGVGSKFWFTARLRKPEVRDPSLISEDAVVALHDLKARCAGRRVLVVDDDDVCRTVTEVLLLEADLVVDSASDGNEAVRMAESQPYDLILMDLQMPELDGLQACKMIRAQKSGTMAIVAMTANVFSKDREAAFAAGMNDFLGKPFEKEKLYAMALKWLDRK